MSAKILRTPTACWSLHTHNTTNKPHWHSHETVGSKTIARVWDGEVKRWMSAEGRQTGYMRLDWLETHNMALWKQHSAGVSINTLHTQRNAQIRTPKDTEIKNEYKHKDTLKIQVRCLPCTPCFQQTGSHFPGRYWRESLWGTHTHRRHDKVLPAIIMEMCRNYSGKSLTML